ncbi:MAG TPA: MBL fold metallo-hydrolase [Anaeromyxobacter sp.]|nr:MBL fold metallo-hydrolase [Anaeromyxobacter sp.]
MTDPEQKRPFRQPRNAAGRFLNLDGSGPASLGRVLRWAALDRLAGRRRVSPRRAAVPRREPDRAGLLVPPPRGAAARVLWLGHASFLVEIDGVSLLIDPALRETIAGGRIRRNVAPGLLIRDLPRIDATLLSHAHYDHLDVPTLEEIRGPMVTGLGVKRYLRNAGQTVRELGWWESTLVGTVRVSFVPAQHWSRRGLLDANAALWGGFVIEGQSACLYHAGDTGLFDGFREIGRRFPAIHLALLPIGAYDPPWFMEPQHMNPEQAVRAFLDLGARAMVGMHWGTFKLTDEPLDEPPSRLAAERERLGLAAERVRVLAVGEAVEAGGAFASWDRLAAAPEGS